MADKDSSDKDKQHIILEAAQKRFGHYGLGKTTMNEIAKDVGMSKASLYYYYPDKERLFLAVIQKEMNELIKLLQAMIGEKETATKKLKQYVSIRHEYFKKLVSLAKINEQTSNAMKVSYDAFREQFTIKEKELVHQIFQQGIKEDEFESFNAKSHADLFVTSMHGLRIAIINRRQLIETKEEDYRAMEQYQKQLTIVFLKSIAKG